MTSNAQRPGSRLAFSAGDRARFEALLKIAAESPFPGERRNALDAARRLAGRYGMSLGEATGRPGGTARTVHVRPPAGSPRTRDVADFVAYSEARLRADKERYERALREAIERGLDPGVRARAESHDRPPAPRPAGRCRSPHSFAEVLLSETTLPLREIVSLTGLDIYRVVGLKLKMRSAA